MMKVLGLILFLCAFSLGFDAPVALGVNPSGRLNVRGPAGFNSSPARVGEPAAYIAYFHAENIEEQAWSSGGEWNWGNLRSAFFCDFHQLDSLYNQLYSELDFSFRLEKYLVGIGYGFSMEWVPGLAKWSKNRMKGAGAYMEKSWYVSAMVDGWLSGVDSDWNFLLGGGVEVGKLGAFFAEWDGRNVVLGNSVRWKFLELKTAYVFPDFGVALEISLSFGRFTLEPHYSFSSEKIGWFGIGAQKRISKKTIL